MERYARQMLFSPIGEEGQKKLQKSSVLIVGCGALGTAIANHLARSGVGNINIVDRDYVEFSNLQRQMLFEEEDAINATPKAVAAEHKLKRINSDIKVSGIVTDVHADNIEEHIRGVDLVLDGTDNFETRFLLNDACFKKGIPFVYGGAVSSRGMSAIFIPGKTPCLRCYISSGDQVGQTCDTIGVISPVVDIVASYQAVEAMKYLIHKETYSRKAIVSLDIWNNHSYELPLTKQKKDCPTCVIKQYPALKSNNDDDNYTVLCGRNTIQITSNKTLNLNSLESQFGKEFKVKKTPFLLRVHLNDEEQFVIFPDGRVLIQGTKDLERAKQLFGNYFH
ncbi:thiamine biosynthesis protein ThiF [Lottiidibacillus patelloidae]|uniref:Thiamine biosynthesis protein ThiF n=1 Tax=Lottiidibacillus patelloidae TaxID=2670334 RepID=A0A263BVG0_9BACI|nr:ThiF family adenylyltransferase [Lottiidibacillus patelloidae]OZM57685.1 thiamine biosynthesis protein ThiF [Lottiidibacillus patelloidae]